MHAFMAFGGEAELLRAIRSYLVEELELGWEIYNKSEVVLQANGYCVGEKDLIIANEVVRRWPNTWIEWTAVHDPCDSDECWRYAAMDGAVQLLEHYRTWVSGLEDGESGQDMHDIDVLVTEWYMREGQPITPPVMEKKWSYMDAVTMRKVEVTTTEKLSIREYC